MSIKFQELLKGMMNEISVQSNRLDHLTSPSFDWLSNIIDAIQPFESTSTNEENEQQEIELNTTNQTESIILPVSNNCLSLKSQVNELVDILSSEGGSNELNENSENDSNNKIKDTKAPLHTFPYNNSKENVPSNGSIAMCCSCASISLVTNPDLDDQGNEMLDSDSFNNDLLETPRHFEISEFASQLTTSAQIFRQKWKESISQNNTSPKKSPK